MPLFRITYTDPLTQEEKVIEKRFEDTQTVKAKEWAEDAAYSFADKGWHKVEELKEHP